MKRPSLYGTCLTILASVMLPASAKAIVINREIQPDQSDNWVVRDETKPAGANEIAPATAADRANLFRAIELAVKALPDGRTQKMLIKVNAGTKSPVTIPFAGSAYLKGNYYNVGNFILDFQGATIYLAKGGGVINAYKAVNGEIRNLNVVGNTNWIDPNNHSKGRVTQGMAFFPNESDGFTIDSVTMQGGDIGIRPQGRQDPANTPITEKGVNWVENISIKGNCKFSDMTQHGIETMRVKSIRITGTITTDDTGGCGILFNATKEAYVYALNSRYASYGVGSNNNYSAFRLANGNASDGKIYMQYLKSFRCGRGFTATTNAQRMSNVVLHEVQIRESANWGIGLNMGAKNVTIEKGFSVRNAWAGLDLGPDTKDCTFSNLRLEGNSTGLLIPNGVAGITLNAVSTSGNKNKNTISVTGVTIRNCSLN